jgi:pimeloyl-ACP methyl ester carboxylesterase
MIVDAPLPGFEPWSRIKHDLRTWHFQFHAEPDLPELLVSGHVQAYVKRFYRRLVAKVDALDDHVIKTAAAGYRRPEQLRSGFDFYRGFAQDERDALELARRALPMPALYVGGEAGAGPFVRFMGLGLTATGATDVRVASVPDAGHWLMLEQPERFAELVKAFIRGEPVGEVPKPLES